MSEFKIKLAEVSIGVNALFETTREFCKDYLTDDKPQFEVTISDTDITDERMRNASQMALEGHTQCDFTDEYMETLALYRKITARLVDFNVLLFHGVILSCKGKAYAFTAKSGTGKTTHTRLWLENIPDCHILNGDKPLLLFKGKKVYACGTPWMGKENYGVNEIAELKGICLLERNKENVIIPVSFSDAYPALLTQTHRPDGIEALKKVINLIKNFENVNLYRLGCNMNPEAAAVAYSGMVKD